MAESEIFEETRRRNKHFVYDGCHVEKLGRMAAVGFTIFTKFYLTGEHVEDKEEQEKCVHDALEELLQLVYRFLDEEMKVNHQTTGKIL